MSKKAIIFLVLTVVFISLLYSPVPVLARDQQEEILEGKIVSIKEEKEIVVMNKKQICQELELLVTKGSLKGQKIIIENGILPFNYIPRYSINDQVVVVHSKDNQNNDIFYIKDYVRRNSLFVLFSIFIIFTVFVARKKGIASILSMIFSFLIIFYSIIPNILNGSDPVVAVILASLFIIPITFYLSHGLNRKTTAAIIGTFIALIITGILAVVFIEMGKLTGFSSEEAVFLQIFKEEAINIKGLLLAGIIIGALGVLDDISISQSAIVFQLKEENKKLNKKDLYQKAMKIGQDHIASMINTLILVYTGAALPLLLLFVHKPHPFLEVINYEIIGEEIIRTLVGSIGLIMAVPITTIIASNLVEK